MSFAINPQSGRIDGVAWVPSPHCDARPHGEPPSLIVVHHISLPPGEFGGEGIVQLFTGQLNPDDHPYYATIAHLKVSAHALVRRDGTVTQFVAFGERAWHAGESYYAGRERCNDFAIGIELEGDGDTPFTPSQYQRLAALVLALQRAYPSIPAAAVVGHSDIAPGRKADPGPSFDWQALWLELQFPR